MLTRSSPPSQPPSRWATPPPPPNIPTIDRALAQGRHSDRTTVIDVMAYMTATDLRQDIGRIKAPTPVPGTWIAYRQCAPLHHVRRSGVDV